MIRLGERDAAEWDIRLLFPLTIARNPPVGRCGRTISRKFFY